ncbi:MAG: hypothetical protein EON98_00320 [Chitinophagaceae bacterium]|nr:MAG: hypothetical protein EON98_00320 [Chitinophagaceae bacterium]
MRGLERGAQVEIRTFNIGFMIPEVLRLFSKCFLVLAYMSLFSCGGEPKVNDKSKQRIAEIPKNDREKLFLKGDVIGISEKEENGKEVVKYFDDAGNLTNELFLIPNGISAYRDYKFDNNKLSGSLMKASGMETEAIFYYSQSGVLTSSKETSRMEDGTLLYEVEHKYSYDHVGRLIYDSSLHGLSERYFYNGENIDSVVKGNETFIYHNGVNDITHKLKKGIREIYTNSYEYDPNGNWIKKTSNINGNEASVVYRTIIYKDSDITRLRRKYDDLVALLNTKVGGHGSTVNVGERPTAEPVIAQSKFNSSGLSNTGSNGESRKCSRCKGSGKCLKCSVPQNVRYKQGEYPRDHREARIGMVVCPQCGGNLMNWGADKNKSCYLCKANGWVYCPECNSTGNGRYIGQCQHCRGKGYE